LLFGMAAPASAESFDCVIDPAVVVKVGSQVPGLLESVLISRGDRVAAGQVIATLASNVELATVALMTEQADSTSEIEAQRARLDLAEKKLARTEELVKRNISAKGDLEEAVAEAEVVKRELAIAEMRRRAAELELNRARAVLEQKTIRSPIGGVVIERTLSKGEYLDQDGQLATIAQLDPLYVEAFLPVSRFGSVEVGMPATVEPNAPIEGVYEGVVKVVDQVFDAPRRPSLQAVPRRRAGLSGPSRPRSVAAVREAVRNRPRLPPRSGRRDRRPRMPRQDPGGRRRCRRKA
jgi:RND family efflux transporter MFP subunit